MNYKLTKTKRRSISISIRDGEVYVRAPLRTSKRDIENFLKSKEAWIKKHVSKQLAAKLKRDSFDLNGESQVLFLGDEVALSEIVEVKDNQHQFKKVLVQFYKDKARDIITNMIEEYSVIMGIKPSNVRITNAKTRWGSCSSKGNVNFSWYLVMAPKEQIEYVVVHELAHMKEMNHSQRFWNIVEKYMPGYKERKKGLKALQDRLNTEDWD